MEDDFTPYDPFSVCFNLLKLKYRYYDESLTAKNFLIDNIEIELEMPEKIAEFKNVEIINNGSIIDNQTTNQALTYGTGKILEELLHYIFC